MYKCTNSVQPRKQGAIMKKVLTVFIAVILVALTAFWCVACDEKNGDASEGKLNIVFLGDSIAEALIGASPVSERDNYGYYALVGRTNGYNYYNHSMSGHLTSGNMANKAGEGLLEVISRETEKATLIRTHIAEAGVIHISVLGNNILQYSLGSLMLEMADRLANIAPAVPKAGINPVSTEKKTSKQESPSKSTMRTTNLCLIICMTAVRLTTCVLPFGRATAKQSASATVSTAKIPTR